MLLIFICCMFDSKSPIYVQERVGKNMKVFNLFKFRTMKLETPSIASHLNSPESLTKLGPWLRSSKLDELPQLWNVLLGSMSFVGPRPNLLNQEELIKFRLKYGIYNHKPGITGLSQIRKIDMSQPEKLSKVDAEMLRDMTIKKYIFYIFLTIAGKGSGDIIKNFNE